MGDGRLCLLQHMLAGAVAGTLEHTLMFPIDTIKTRMQALSHPGQQACCCLLPSMQPCMPICSNAPKTSIHKQQHVLLQSAHLIASLQGALY